MDKSIKYKQVLVLLILFLASLSIIIFYNIKNEVNRKNNRINISNKKELYIINKDEKYGLINKSGDIIVEPKYDMISDYSEGMFVVSLMIDDKYMYGYINNAGEEVIPPIYTEAQEFSEGLALVMTNGKKMFINKENKIVIPYNKILKDYRLYSNKFDNGVIIIQNFEYGENETPKFGLMNKEGKVILTPKYDYIGEFKNKLAVVNLGGNWSELGIFGGKFGYINNIGEEVIELKYEQAKKFSDNLGLIKIDGKYGYINNNNKIVIQPQYEMAKSFSEGCALVYKNNQENKKYPVFIDKRNREIIDCSNYIMETFFETGESEYSEFKNGLAYFGIKENDKIKYGYINKEGKEVIDALYKKVFLFNEYGYAKVVKFNINDEDEDYIIINKNGIKQTENVYSNVYLGTEFDVNNIAKVYNNRNDDIFYAYINLQGDYIWKQRGYDKNEEVWVKGAKELLDNIGSYKTIYIDSDIDFSTVIKEGKLNYINKNKYVDFNIWDGIILKDLVELNIIGKMKSKKTKIVTPLGENAKVFKIINSNRIVFNNIEMGHETDTYCDGAVLRFDNCNNISIIKSNLYGCGTYGVIARNVTNLLVDNSNIYKCTCGLLDLESTVAKVVNSELKETHDLNMIRAFNSMLDVENCKIYSNLGSALIEGGNNSQISLKNNKIYNNNLDKLYKFYSKTIKLDLVDNIYDDNLFQLVGNNKSKDTKYNQIYIDSKFKYEDIIVGVENAIKKVIDYKKVKDIGVLYKIQEDINKDGYDEYLIIYNYVFNNELKKDFLILTNLKGNFYTIINEGRKTLGSDEKVDKVRIGSIDNHQDKKYVFLKSNTNKIRIYEISNDFDMIFVKEVLDDKVKEIVENDSYEVEGFDELDVYSIVSLIKGKNKEYVGSYKYRAKESIKNIETQYKLDNKIYAKIDGIGEEWVDMENNIISNEVKFSYLINEEEKDLICLGELAVDPLEPGLRFKGKDILLKSPIKVGNKWSFDIYSEKTHKKHLVDCEIINIINGTVVVSKKINNIEGYKNNIRNDEYTIKIGEGLVNRKMEIVPNSIYEIKDIN